jgi:hypothetical protein
MEYFALVAGVLNALALIYLAHAVEEETKRGKCRDQSLKALEGGLEHERKQRHSNEKILGIDNPWRVEGRPATNEQIFRLDEKLNLLAKAAGFEYRPADTAPPHFARPKKGRA